LLRQLLVRFKSRPEALFSLVFVALANQMSIVALAAGPPADLTVAGNLLDHKPAATSCLRTADLVDGCPTNGDESFQVNVPDGSRPCPSSGQGAACATTAPATTGVASTPDGHAPCAEAGPASCTNSVLPASESGASHLGTAAAPVIHPSLPDDGSSLATGAVQRLELAVNTTSAMPGHNIQLTATADRNVAGSGRAIAIFDRTTGALVGSCSQGSQCIVNYSSKAGTHEFGAYVTAPTSKFPLPMSTMSSNAVKVSWIGVTLSSQKAIVAPTEPVTVTATATIPVDKTGWLLQLYDAHTKARLTYCSTGTSCSTSLIQTTGGGKSVVAALAEPSPNFPAAGSVVAQSGLISPTWLSVVLDAKISSLAIGTPIQLKATANTDLTDTNLAIGIYNDQNQLVSAPCLNYGSTCSAQVGFAGGTPKFSAAIGAVPASFDTTNTVGQVMQKISGPPKLVDIKARSAAIPPQVNRMLWGVDSCKAFTSDPNGGNGLLPQVKGSLGTPDFWGRYLTQTVCPGISGAEIAAARANHMAILPIYNDYNCSGVVGYGAGRQYAAAAAEAAWGLGIPKGRALVIDIEPPGSACPGAAYVDAAFIQGWYDGLTATQYVAAYYGDGTGGKEFGSAWCGAVAAKPEIAQNSYVWSFQPSLTGGFGKGNAPGYAPNAPGCAAHSSAWQYVLSAGGDPDVDQDLIVSELPLWYP
jgi:hypothetical protein